MVNVEPLRLIRTTALKERLQLADKLNEIISVLDNVPDDTESRLEQVEELVATGTYASVQLLDPVQGQYTLRFTDQLGNNDDFNFIVKDITNITLVNVSGSLYRMTVTYSTNTSSTFEFNVKSIVSVTATQSGDTVTLRITYNDSTYNDVTFDISANTYVTLATTQDVTGAKHFSGNNEIKVLTTPRGSNYAVNQAYVESTVEGVNGLVHKSANEIIAGQKQFTRTINGNSIIVADSNSTIGELGTYKMIMKLTRNNNLGSRNHISIDVYTRQRDRLPDTLMLYVSSDTIQGFSIYERKNIENHTYVLSYDNDFIYLWKMSTNSNSDTVQTIIKTMTEYAILTINTISDDERFVTTVIGTEYGRLVP